MGDLAKTVLLTIIALFVIIVLIFLIFVPCENNENPQMNYLNSIEEIVKQQTNGVCSGYKIKKQKIILNCDILNETQKITLKENIKKEILKSIRIENEILISFEEDN